MINSRDHMVRSGYIHTYKKSMFDCNWLAHVWRYHSHMELYYGYLLIFLLDVFCAGFVAGCTHASFVGGWGWVAGVEARLGRGVASNVESVEWL